MSYSWGSCFFIARVFLFREMRVSTSKNYLMFPWKFPSVNKKPFCLGFFWFYGNPQGEKSQPMAYSPLQKDWKLVQTDLWLKDWILKSSEDLAMSHSRDHVQIEELLTPVTIAIHNNFFPYQFVSSNSILYDSLHNILATPQIKLEIVIMETHPA